LVVFAVVEVLILPVLAQTFLSHQPLVAAAWIGLAVKADGAAVAAGGITEAFLLAKSASEGVHYQAGWLLGTTATIKVFIDVFIGIWVHPRLYLDHRSVRPTGRTTQLNATQRRLGRDGSSSPEMGQQKTGIASCLLTDHRRSSLERKPQTSVEKLVPEQWSEAWTRPIYNRCATT
jgi:hypothetical protein